ncbi:DUF1134 domain-containing protein [Candidatus Liberibacter sp.]|uniref:DUF1134 domain-containing protein n=1 Tax=Candidatus Liberibacter sp. TaxID=34022 RepID=UPI002175334C|nr:DUF1134 domain-containing protein [Candidatus Liberibacter sp.]
MLIVVLLTLLWMKAPVFAKNPDSHKYSPHEISLTGKRFFGSLSQGLAQSIEKAFQSYGMPNGYILGEEISASFFASIKYGKGILSTKNLGMHRLFWKGPSLGVSLGGSGARCMMLVYNLPDIESIYGRYGSFSGSAFFVAGFEMAILVNKLILIVPICSGIGMHLGMGAGYIVVTRNPTWIPL